MSAFSALDLGLVVAAHGNSIRALVKYLDGISDADIVGLNIPNGIPLVYELDADAAKALEWLDAHRGEGYDLLGLLGFAFRPFKGFFRLWWCSEAVAAMCGFAEPWRYDVATLESVCARIGRRVQ